MSEEAKKFIEVTDLVDHTDYENSDCGEGYILNEDHLAELLEAYHQERSKEKTLADELLELSDGVGVSFNARTIETSKMHEAFTSAADELNKLTIQWHRDELRKLTQKLKEDNDDKGFSL